LKPKALNIYSKIILLAVLFNSSIQPKSLRGPT
jgi:hypothetical protein